MKKHSTNKGSQTSKRYYDQSKINNPERHQYICQRNTLQTKIRKHKNNPVKHKQLLELLAQLKTDFLGEPQVLTQPEPQITKSQKPNLVIKPRFVTATKFVEIIKVDNKPIIDSWNNVVEQYNQIIKTNVRQSTIDNDICNDLCRLVDLYKNVNQYQVVHNRVHNTWIQDVCDKTTQLVQANGYPELNWVKAFFDYKYYVVVNKQIHGPVFKEPNGTLIGKVVPVTQLKVYDSTIAAYKQQFNKWYNTTSVKKTRKRKEVK